jgi:drug/metabolite transporter (DMT)-like permease
MLLYLLLGVTALTATVQNIIKQRFNDKVKGSAFLFSAATAFFALLFFIVINLVYERDFYYGVELILPSLGFAIAYAFTIIFTQLALLYGPLAKSTLVISCSLIIPSLYGIFVQGVYIDSVVNGTKTISEALSSALSPTLIIGTLCLIASLVLINSEKKSPDAPKEKVTLKWIVFIALAFVGNGACSVVQTVKTDFFGTKGNANFMIVALAVVAVSLTLVTLFFKREREQIKITLTKGALYSASCGIANGLTNFLVIFLNSRNFPACVLFPVVSAGGMVLVFLFSFFVKKERFTALQYVGYALGVVSLVLLNI